MHFIWRKKEGPLVMSNSNQAKSSFWRFLASEIDWFILRKRWLLVLPFSLFLAYYVFGIVTIGLSTPSSFVNIWDILFRIFGDGGIIFYIINLLFLFLISDYSLENKWGEWILLRVSSRKKWWLGKLLLLAISAFWYLILIFSIAGGVASFVLPWQNKWSSIAMSDPSRILLNPHMMDSSPSSTFLQLGILLVLGWLSLGLITLIFARLFNNAIVGFFFGLFTNIFGLVTLKGYVIWHYPWSLLTIDSHLLMNMQNIDQAPLNLPPFALSLLYWFCWISLFGSVGFALGKRKDFLPPQHHLDA